MVNTSTYYDTDTFRQELQPNERILWSGKPKQGILLSLRDGIGIASLIIWVFIVLSIFTQVGNSNVWTIVPFLLLVIGLNAVIYVGHFLFERYSRSKTDYAVTNQRALIVSGVWDRKIETVNLKELSDLVIDEKDDGSGSIIFGRVSSLYQLWTFFIYKRTDMYGVPAFKRIEEVREVYNLIQRVKSGLN